jgi:hypothetical protein
LRLVAVGLRREPDRWAFGDSLWITRGIRLFFQYAEKGRFTEPVERITGRQVKAFISGIDTNTDTACELFVLESEAGPASGEPTP